jgi:heme-degrading monooxygenase HmoA
MAVLEIIQLRLRKVAADDPALIQSLSSVREKLRTNSQFYNCVKDPALIYILGIWPNLDAHQKFLDSPARDEVLGPQEDMLQFCWTMHVELDGMHTLPLESPILAIERLIFKKECMESVEKVVARYTQQLQRMNSFKTVYGWRCDAAQETHEALVFTGHGNAQIHSTFAAKGIDDNNTAMLNEQFETVQIILGRNLERKDIGI